MQSKVSLITSTARFYVSRKLHPHLLMKQIIIRQYTQIKQLWLHWIEVFHAVFRSGECITQIYMERFCKCSYSCSFRGKRTVRGPQEACGTTSFMTSWHITNWDRKVHWSGGFCCSAACSQWQYDSKKCILNSKQYT